MTHFDINLSTYQANRLQKNFREGFKKLFKLFDRSIKKLKINYSINPTFQTVNFSPS